MSDLDDKAIAILRATHDGNDLAPEHLKLVELAVNGQVSDSGQVAFDQLHTDVVAGQYKRPWFHGVEHLTLDHHGFVFWKGQEVEHYAAHYAYTDKAGREARLVAQRCRYLEAIGASISTESVIWRWQEKQLRDCLAKLGCEWISCCEMRYGAYCRPNAVGIFGRVFWDPDPSGFYVAQLANAPMTLDHVDGPKDAYREQSDFRALNDARTAIESFAEDVLANHDPAPKGD